MTVQELTLVSEPFYRFRVSLFSLAEHPWGAIALVFVILGSLMLGLRLYQHYASPHPEWVRKLLHISMGIVTLSFPWLFDSPLPVVVLAVLSVGWLLTVRGYPPLRRSLGSVLGNVERRSLGEVYFPIAVAVLFALSGGDPLLFGIPMLMLTLADAVAAIIGVTYGKVRYAATIGQKSAEGSITFFTVAFLSVHIPLLLLSTTGRAETLLIALILGLLVMLLEAIAWNGLDNLLIPLGGFLLLNAHLQMGLLELSTNLVITLILVIFVFVWRRRTTLNDSALMGAAFVGYLTWSVGGLLWLLPPVIVLVSYPSLISWVNRRETPLSEEERQAMPWLPPAIASPEPLEPTIATSNPKIPPEPWHRIHTVSAVLSVSAAGLFWLLWVPVSPHTDLIYPYTLSYSTGLAMIGVAGFSPVDYWRSPTWHLLLGTILKGWLLPMVPLLLLRGISVHLWLAGLGTAIAALLYYLTRPWLMRHPPYMLNWCCRSLYALSVSWLGWLPGSMS